MIKLHIMLGAPGSGKGTLAHKLSNESTIHLSTGDLFRHAVATASPLGVKVKEFMDKAMLVPDELTNAVVSEYLNGFDFENRVLILDGYPRTVSQVNVLVEVLKPLLSTYEVKTHYLEVSHEELQSRITGRRTCKQCGRSYHITGLKPKVDGICDDCGTELTQRKDDNLETFESRYKEFIGETLPAIKEIMKYY